MLMQHESSSQLLPVSLLRNSIRSRLVNLCDNHSNDDHNNDDKQDNEEAPPLLAVTATRLDVVVDFLALLLNVGNERFLLLDDLVKVLEQLGEFDHLTFYVLDGLVALFYIAEGR
jgi:hypothetical protein